MTLGKLGDGGLIFETKEARRVRLEADPESASPDARDAARAVLNRLTMGEDPAAKTQGPTDLIRTVWAEYVEKHLKKRRASTAGAAQRVYSKRLQGWYEKPVKTISKRDVLDVLDSYTSAGHDAGANHRTGLQAPPIRDHGVISTVLDAAADTFYEGNVVRRCLQRLY